MRENSSFSNSHREIIRSVFIWESSLGARAHGLCSVILVNDLLICSPHRLVHNFRQLRLDLSNFMSMVNMTSLSNSLQFFRQFHLVFKSFRKRRNRSGAHAINFLPSQIMMGNVHVVVGAILQHHVHFSDSLALLLDQGQARLCHDCLFLRLRTDALLDALLN